jgi:hypothetical protein
VTLRPGPTALRLDLQKRSDPLNGHDLPAAAGVNRKCFQITLLMPMRKQRRCAKQNQRVREDHINMRWIEDG